MKVKLDLDKEEIKELQQVIHFGMHKIEEQELLLPLWYRYEREKDALDFNRRWKRVEKAYRIGTKVLCLLRNEPDSWKLAYEDRIGSLKSLMKSRYPELFIEED
jgi:hypothetical protein